jgi:L-alanine-DL-glutamate epimerase-like enolase superfamily enzyme
LKALTRELALAAPFKIASHTWKSTRNIFCRVGYDGVFGFGESSCDPRSGDSFEEVEAALAEVDLARLASPFDLEAIDDDLLPPGPARAALDIALHDLAGKLAGVPVAVLLGGGGRTPPPTSLTVPIAPPEDMAARAAALADHPILKVKVGFDGDLEAVAAIRAAYDGVLRVDANEGWTPEQAIARLNELDPYGIELCEQPIPAGDPRSLAMVRAGSPIPVFADEDVDSAADVIRLAGAVDGVNLKLRKTGGLREMLRAIHAARACELEVMIGCDLDTGIAATAGAHIAGLADHVDLDGPLLLAEDPFPGVSYERGRLVLPEGPGLGLGEVQL